MALPPNLPACLSPTGHLTQAGCGQGQACYPQEARLPSSYDYEMLQTACKPFKELGTTGASFLSGSNRQQENEKVSVPVETKANSLAPEAEAYTTLEKSWKENVTSNS